MPFSLRTGFDQFERKDDLPVDLTNLIRSSSEKADFISWRGIITKLMCLPYSNDNFSL